MTDIQDLTQLTKRDCALWPCFDDEMKQAVQAVLESGKVNYWTGEEGRLFEKEYAASLGLKHAIALANGTLALELALYALDIGPGDEVIVPSRSFIASASCVSMRGATPVFADVDNTSQNITAETISDVLSPRTKAIIAVHLAGWACDLDPILELVQKHNLHLIEDCAQAHGATYKGRPVGTFGTAAAFSFCQDKIITTGGEGGLLVTNDADLWEKAWSFKDHGKNWGAIYNQQHKGVFKWLHHSIGTNWRLTEMQSAIGRIALRQLPNWVETRRQHASQLNAVCAEFDAIECAIPTEKFGHSYYKHYATVKPERLAAGWSRDRIVQTLQSLGVVCGSGVCPELYREKAYATGKSYASISHPVAARLGETTLMFAVHPTLTAADMQHICSCLRATLRAATQPVAITAQRAA